MFSETTTYSIINELHQPSTISICKLEADILQITEENVHVIIQRTYDKIAVLHSKLSRRKKGNLVRLSISLYVQKKPQHLAILKKLL